MINNIKKAIFICFLTIFVSSLYAEILPYTDKLKQQLQVAYESQPQDYLPRTQYLCDRAQPCFINRLILEQSPYLLQHAHNPVDWYPWGKQALDKAKAENKPIFLSIGYAACHWCHVMEKESFDNLQVAKLLNKHFIAIKVDREQRPDIDELFGHAVMMFQGQQGWPMSVFLTSDGKPFFGGGYYSADEFKSMLLKMSDLWTQHHDETVAKAKDITEQLQSANRSQEKDLEISDELRRRAIKSLLSIVDSYFGGFGESEKFPREPWLYLLLDDSIGQSSNDDSLKALNLSLTKMAMGGIYDQLAGGFHRYATDPYWKIPHFEKMLYNQALLIPLYLQANSINSNPYFLRVAKQTANFLIATMKDSNGGFYASIDADVDGKEGQYYLWHIKDWKKLLSQTQQDFITELYAVDEYGEVDNENNVLYQSDSIEEYASYKNQSVNNTLSQLDDVRNYLLNIRNKRKQPDLDKKIIMGWNGLVITALVEASLYFHDDDYRQAAIKAADFVWNEMHNEKIFYRVHYRGELSQTAQLDDYAYYLQALIKLYDMEQNKNWLNRAEIVAGLMFDKFWDDKRGGFFNAIKDENAPLPVRTKSAFDKTLISANSISAQMLTRLFNRTGDEQYKQKAQATLSSFTTDLLQVPSAYSGLLVAAHELQRGERNTPLYAARGHVRIDAEIKFISEKKYELMINLNIDDSWHINSNTPLDKNLIATTVNVANNSSWVLNDLQYPDHKIINLGYSNDELALYQGRITIKSHLSKLNTELNPLIKLKLQACNDRLCLPPEDVLLIPRMLVEY